MQRCKNSGVSSMTAGSVRAIEKQAPIMPIVFTDLDGTLLDHYSYSADKASDLLDLLRIENVPVIFSSSKTRAEIEPLRSRLENVHPFICENGAAVCIPQDYFLQKPLGTLLRSDYWVKTFTEPREYWLAMLDRLSASYAGEFESFSSMSVARICELTGLSTLDAEQAKKREYSEPILWKGDESRRQTFINDLIRSGGCVQQGGRFLSLSGDSNKGSALKWLLMQFKRQAPEGRFHTVALGDGENDVAMLEASDTAIVVASPVHAAPALNRRAGVRFSNECGPAGWQAELSKELKTLRTH